MSTNPLSYEEAIDQVHDYLLSLSDTEFNELLIEHKDGDIAVILDETEALRTRAESTEQTPGSASTLPALFAGYVAPLAGGVVSLTGTVVWHTTDSLYNDNSPIMAGTFIQNDTPEFLMSWDGTEIIIGSGASPTPVNLDYLAGYNLDVKLWGGVESILINAQSVIQPTTLPNALRRFVCHEEPNVVEDFECKAA